MKLKPAAFFLLVSFASSKGYSQQDTSKAWVDTIQYGKSNERYFFNGKMIAVAKLEPMLNRFNASAIALTAYKKRATPGTIALVTGVTAGIISLARIKRTCISLRRTPPHYLLARGLEYR